MAIKQLIGKGLFNEEPNNRIENKNRKFVKTAPSAHIRDLRSVLKKIKNKKRERINERRWAINEASDGTRLSQSTHAGG